MAMLAPGPGMGDWGRTGARGAGRRFRQSARGAGRRSAPPCAPANLGSVWSDKDTQKAQAHKSFSQVGINGMNDYQATYNKRWQNQSFLSVNVFTFVGSRPPQHSWPTAAAPLANHDEVLSFGWMID